MVIEEGKDSYLRSLRKNNKWTIYHVAGVTGLSPGSVSRLETGKQRYSVGSVQRMAEAYGVSTDKLLEEGTFVSKSA